MNFIAIFRWQCEVHFLCRVVWPVCILLHGGLVIDVLGQTQPQSGLSWRERQHIRAVPLHQGKNAFIWVFMLRHRSGYVSCSTGRGNSRPGSSWGCDPNHENICTFLTDERNYAIRPRFSQPFAQYYYTRSQATAHIRHT